jgi:uncharacterized membrane protein YdbT with pleckstrin-like domain
MSYPEKLLAEDEEVVEHLHPHWITLVPGIVLFIVICGLAGAGIGFIDNHYARLAILAVALILIIWLTLAPIIKWRSTHYVVTNRRVLIRRGVLNHVGRDISLARINDVAYEQSVWDRVVRAGSITIESAGEHGQETLVDIPRANQVQQTLNRLIEADAVRRAQHGVPRGGGQSSTQAYPPSDGPDYPQQG